MARCLRRRARLGYADCPLRRGKSGMPLTPLDHGAATEGLPPGSDSLGQWRIRISL